jgi:CBS domain-containing protein
MRVTDILRAKGSTVATIAPDATLGEAADLLHRLGIGALVVAADGRHPDGIISERDVVRCLAEATDAADVLARPVADAMAADLVTCAPGDSCDALARTMTDRRHRHLPVIEQDELVGIVSIGDIVKARLGELEEERRALHDYISTGR